MSAYVWPNYKTKKAFREAINAGEKIVIKENTPWGRQEAIEEGIAYVEGPHYPEPHKWYAKVLLKGGKVVKVS
jgi:hypothetical protein